jgi:structural maintenance of chromosome 2
VLLTTLSFSIFSASHDLKELQKQQESLSKKINKKVMNMLDKAEQEYAGLVEKRKVVESDRAKIEKVILELDVKKNQALQTTWIKVNRDFGSIFSTLLPGATAKLEPPEGGSVLEGLEVKVAFGKVWKETLSELSGGQRSLLALSLILALLLFKPAPMYILDEVDAALDLSHTQNIGAMLRTHFSNSQFIVVSLKEGMFNNANVIFRTKFVDGSSTVSRTANGSAVALLKAKDKARQQAASSSSSSSAAASGGDENAGASGGGRKGPQKKRGKGAAAADDDDSGAQRAGVC